MPLFFFVGGFAHQRSWDQGRGRSGGRYGTSSAAGCQRLAVPALVLLGVWLGSGHRPLRLRRWTGSARAVSLILSPLWFLVVYLMLIAAVAAGALAAPAVRRAGARRAGRPRRRWSTCSASTRASTGRPGQHDPRLGLLPPARASSTTGWSAAGRRVDWTLLGRAVRPRRPGRQRPVPGLDGRRAGRESRTWRRRRSASWRWCSSRPGSRCWCGPGCSTARAPPPLGDVQRADQPVLAAAVPVPLDRHGDVRGRHPLRLRRRRGPPGPDRQPGGSPVRSPSSAPSSSPSPSSSCSPAAAPPRPPSRSRPRRYLGSAGPIPNAIAGGPRWARTVRASGRGCGAAAAQRRGPGEGEDQLGPGTVQRAILSLHRLRDPRPNVLVDGWRQATRRRLDEWIAPLVVLTPPQHMLDLHTVVGEAARRSVRRWSAWTPRRRTTWPRTARRPGPLVGQCWQLGPGVATRSGGWRPPRPTRSWPTSSGATTGPPRPAGRRSTPAVRGRAGPLRSPHGVGWRRLAAGRPPSEDPSGDRRSSTCEPSANARRAGTTEGLGGRSLVLAPSVFCVDGPSLMRNVHDESAPRLLFYPVLRATRRRRPNLWADDAAPGHERSARLSVPPGPGPWPPSPRCAPPAIWRAASASRCPRPATMSASCATPG